jgi:8-oxo-dGTP pyrophosphatase MutT (NUDIX family)
MRGVLERRLAALLAGQDPRERFLANVVGPVSAELEQMLAMPSHQAAVLIPIVERPAEPVVLLTERARHLTHHPGQVSFPGGRLEHPAEGAVAAALREAQEEVGLAAEHVTVVGRLPAHVTGTGFQVEPVVGIITDSFVASPDPAEVDQVFEVPLDFLLDPANQRTQLLERFGTRFVSYEFHWEGHRIWGATAAMIVSFSRIFNR